MANTLSVVDMVAKESQRIAHEKISFIGTVDRQYDDSFKYQAGRGPNGQTLRIRKPNMYTRTQGSRVMDVQDTSEATQTITVATQDHVDIRFNSTELMQSVNSGSAFDDLSKNYIEPAIATLIAGVEGDFLTYATKATYQVVGTAGTAITTLATPGAARAKLNQQLAPKGNRSIQMDSVTMGGLVNGMAAYFNPSNALGDQFREGLIARTAMADYYEQEKLWTLPNSSDVTGSSDAAALVTDGGNTIDLHTLLPVATQVVGQVFTIAGVYDCNPETKAAYPHLKQFTITAIGATLTTVSPSFILTGARKNMCTSTGANLTAASFNAQVITFVGAASTNYVQQLMYHKEAFQFITADLPVMGGSHQCSVKRKDNLSLRVWIDSDIRNDELLCRIDMLYGMAALRPEWACRMIGAANA